MLRQCKEAARLVRQLTATAEQACCSSGRRAVSTSAAASGEAPPDNTWLPPDATFYVHQYPWHDKYCRQRRVMPVGPRYPALATDVYIAPSAVVAGDVDIMDGVTVMHGSVVRGDLNNISIGPFSTIQENAVIHAARNGATGLPASTVLGTSVTVGAGAMLRSCKVEDMAVIGERSIVMEGSVISAKAVLLPGTVVPPAKLIPKGQVWGGNPARFVRSLTHDEEMETGQLSDSHEKWRDLYTMEDLPYGGNWKRAEALDPAEDRLWPSGEPPEWVPTHRH